ARQRDGASDQPAAGVVARRTRRCRRRRAPGTAPTAPRRGPVSGVNDVLRFEGEMRMRQILIVYGTTDGQTRKIAQVLAEDLRARCCSVDLLDAAGPLARLSPECYDAVIVGASVHIGAFQRSVVRWVRHHAKALKDTQTAFLPVCLAILEKR